MQKDELLKLAEIENAIFTLLINRSYGEPSLRHHFESIAINALERSKALRALAGGE